MADIASRFSSASISEMEADRAQSEAALRYARGFALIRAEQQEPRAIQNWSRFSVAGHTLLVDPRVPVDSASGDERTVWLIGDAFDPEHKVYEGLASVLASGDLLDHLDRLAGRFVLIVQNVNGQLEVYHDAMGSRTVFYGGGVVASHAHLIAEMLGTGLRDWVIPFVTSRGYIKRDVKFFPGLESTFEGVTQLTPNTRLVTDAETSVERYWPREAVQPTTDEQAINALAEHMRGLAEYLRIHDAHPVIGVSAGRDSRCVLAGTAHLTPSLFTFVRGERGSSMTSTDSRTAFQLAQALGLDLELVKIEIPPHLNSAATEFAKQYRVNTGHIRGNTQAWVEYFWDADSRRDSEIYVRGFGGEVMRGFAGSRPLTSATANALANTYDVNAGSTYTRQAFAKFIEVAQWDVDRFFGCSLSDLFYWEDRMGIWGSSTFTESDMAFRSMPAYNSRNLFTTFWGLEDRNDSRHFAAVAAILAPELEGIPFS